MEFKVVDLGANGKPICDFILVINSNFSRICYCFRDIQAPLKDGKSLNFTTPPLFEDPARGNLLEFLDEIWLQKTRIMELPEGEEIMTLAFFVLIQYRRVTDGRTDRRHVALEKTRASIASRW